MNFKLKLKIIEKFGGQWRFAQAVNEHECIVSKIVRNRKELSHEKKLTWAKVLGCRVGEIFSAPNS